MIAAAAAAAAAAMAAMLVLVSVSQLAARVRSSLALYRRKAGGLPMVRFSFFHVGEGGTEMGQRKGGRKAKEGQEGGRGRRTGRRARKGSGH